MMKLLINKLLKLLFSNLFIWVLAKMKKFLLSNFKIVTWNGKAKKI